MKPIARLTGVLFVAALALPCFAQTYGPPGAMPPGGAPAPGANRGYGPPSAGEVEQNLADFHRRLALRPEQESAWQGFASAVRQQTRQMQSMQGSMLRPPPTAPERLTQMARFMQQRASGMTAVARALTTLYGVLDEDQRSIVEEAFPSPPGPPPMGGAPIR
jgi:hypothetical protein